MAAAKEFNIGKDTLVDFLAGKGFSKDDLKPTSKLSEDMYRSLQQEFNSDKVAKIKSDQIDLPRGGTVEAKKKRDEEEIVFKKETKKVVKEEEKPVIVPAVEEKPEVKPEVKVEVKPEVVETKPEVIEPVAKEPEPIELANIEAPEIEGPKILSKIDLSTIDSSTRPRKPAQKKPEEVIQETPREPEVFTKEPPVKKDEPVHPPKQVEEIQPEKTPEIQVSGQPPAQEPEVQPMEEDIPEIFVSDPEGPHLPLIENIKADKLEGPKILGKIQLPVSNDTRPKPNDEKRKRKRIPVEKRGEPFSRQQGTGPGTGQQGQPPRPPGQFQRPSQGGFNQECHDVR